MQKMSSRRPLQNHTTKKQINTKTHRKTIEQPIEQPSIRSPFSYQSTSALRKNEVERVDFIELDVQCGEYEALGAALLWFLVWLSML